MKINSEKATQRIIKDATPMGSRLRKLLLTIQVGESISMSLADWPFKSEPAEYLYTMRRIGRTYSYKTVDKEEILIYRTS